MHMKAGNPFDSQLASIGEPSVKNAIHNMKTPFGIFQRTALSFSVSLLLFVPITAPASQVIAWGSNYGGQTNLPPGLANAFTVRTATRDRHTYMLGYRNALADTNWTWLPRIRGYGYGVMRRVSNPAPAVSHRFYRVTENP